MAPIVPFQDNAKTIAARPVPGSEQPGFSAIYRHAEMPEFHIPDTPASIFQDAVKAVPDMPFIGRRPWDFAKGQHHNYYQWTTYQQASDLSQQLGSALTSLAADGALGSELPSDFSLALWGPNTPEFQLIFQQSVGFGRRLVCIYDSFGLDNVLYVLAHSESVVVFTTSAHLPQLLANVDQLPQVKAFVVIDEQPPAGVLAPKLPSTQIKREDVAAAWAASNGAKLFTFDELITLGTAKLVPYPPYPAQDAPAMFCYTSGTTGKPKGALVTHAQLAYGATAQTLSGPLVEPGNSLFSYLPVAHIYEVLLEMVTIKSKATIGYSCGDVTKILEDLQILKPTVFPSVPRVLNRVAAQIEMQMAGDGFKAKLLRRAVESKMAYHDVDGQVSHAFWDRLVFRKVRALLGGNVELIISGSAPIRPEVLKLLRVALVADVREGYGATENMATVSLNMPWDKELGSVGGPLPGVEMRLRELPDLGYRATDKPRARGEILLRGPTVFPGYYKDEEKTAEAFADGWLATGDVGAIDERGRLYIIDRVKNLVKLSQGEYVAIEKTEQVYGGVPELAQLMVYGDSLQDYLVAIAVPEAEPFAAFVSKILGKNVKPEGIAPYVSDPTVVKALLKALVTLGRSRGLSGVEMIKGLYLTTDAFTPDNVLTPTFKLRRPDAAKYFRKNLDDMYASGPVTP